MSTVRDQFVVAARRNDARLLFASGVILLSGCARPLEDRTALPDSAEEYPGLVVADSDTASVAMPFAAAPLSDGSVVVATQELSRLVMILTPKGHLTRTIGRIGEGPGEYQFAMGVMVRNDTILISDGRGPFQAFDQHGEYIGAIPMRTVGAGRQVFIRGDSLLVAMPIPSARSFGLPLHVISPSGDVVRSFGAEDRSFDGSQESVMMTMITDSTVLIARQFAYSLELWNLNGGLISALQLDHPWFTAEKADLRAIHKTNPDLPVKIHDIHYDHASGRLSVLIQRRRGNRSQNVPDAHDDLREDATARRTLHERVSTHEQVVEVREFPSGALLGAARPPSGYFTHFLTDGRLFGVTAGDGGVDLPAVWNPEFSSTFISQE